MSRKKKNTEETCPICGNYYGKYRQKTRHHIFVKWFYCDGLVVYACSECHQKEFHKYYPMYWDRPWSRSQCLSYWVQFCKSKGKNAFAIYPELCKLQPLY
jgi:hypothetical protein